MLDNKETMLKLNSPIVMKLLSLVPLAGIIYCLGASSLWIYLNRLGRLDVFSLVLESEKTFDIIAFFLIMSIILFMLLFYNPSALMILFFNNKFYKSERYPETIEYSSKAILITSILSTTAIFFIAFYSLFELTSKNIWALFAITTLVNIFCLYFFNRNFLKGGILYHRVALYKYKWYLIFTSLLIVVIAITPMTALSLFIPLIEANDDSSPESLASVILVSLAIIIISQVPATLFLRKKDIPSAFKRSCLSIGTSLLLLIPISFVIKPIPIMIIDISMKLSGVTDFREHNYTIKSDDYPLEIFDYPNWNIQKNSSANKYTIKGVTFFSYKNISLVCPADIKKTYKEARKFSIFDKDFDENSLNNLDKKMQLCFVFDKSKIIQWNSPT
ncbi:hypothetical protein [Pantoea agglomerans]|uniref:hypothetical protein n=1 Tax=Enterobacter agglomerans TaxID=549 RepID=UPI001303BFDD|nr:hypothetical protein [Pantoea agglomerans]